ncbi:MAG: hypothetical protein CMN57_00835 [Gammaproteobacteria bacterium]|nr:hypothetical protein [Gammaproteobacteria bacterium]
MKLRSDNAWHHQPLPWLVLASLALHAGLLAWQAPLQHEVPALSSRSGALAIQLTAPPSPAQQPPAPTATGDAAAATPAGRAATDGDQRQASRPDASAPAQPSVPGPVAAAGTARAEPERQASVERPAPARGGRPAGAEAQQPPRTAAATATAHPEQTRAEAQGSAVLEEIRDALQQHFFYPRLARLRNWEGDVLLGFQVRSDGRIDDVEVLKSSGRAVLDRAALSALRSVRQVAYNAAQPVDLQLPVAYRLH